MAAKIPREGGSSGTQPPVDLQELLKKLVLKDKELGHSTPRGFARTAEEIGAQR
jgi:hypothetical protein